MLSGFDTEGCRSVRITAYSLIGSSQSMVEHCTLEVDYEGNRQDEVQIHFGANPPALASLQALIEALNRTL